MCLLTFFNVLREIQSIIWRMTDTIIVIHIWRAKLVCKRQVFVPERYNVYCIYYIKQTHLYCTGDEWKSSQLGTRTNAQLSAASYVPPRLIWL